MRLNIKSSKTSNRAQLSNCTIYFTQKIEISIKRETHSSKGTIDKAIEQIKFTFREQTKRKKKCESLEHDIESEASAL